MIPYTNNKLVTGLLFSSKKENVNGIFCPEFNFEFQDTFPVKLLSKEKSSSFRFILSPDKISNLIISSLNVEVDLFFICKRSSCGMLILMKFLFGSDILNS